MSAVEPAGLLRLPDDSLHALERRLIDQSHLFDDPGAYQAGVRDALAAIATVAAPTRDGEGRSRTG